MLSTTLWEMVVLQAQQESGCPFPGLPWGCLQTLPHSGLELGLHCSYQKNQVTPKGLCDRKVYSSRLDFKKSLCPIAKVDACTPRLCPHNSVPVVLSLSPFPLGSLGQAKGRGVTRPPAPFGASDSSGKARSSIHRRPDGSVSEGQAVGRGWVQMIPRKAGPESRPENTWC